MGGMTVNDTPLGCVQGQGPISGEVMQRLAQAGLMARLGSGQAPEMGRMPSGHLPPHE